MSVLPTDHPARRHGLALAQPAARSTAGIPLANGLLGALVWGDAQGVLISLDRTDVWDLSEIPEYAGPGYTNAQLQAWVQAGDLQAIAARFEAPYKRPAPTKLPMGRIRAGAVGGACRLDLVLAEAEVETSVGRVSIGIDALHGVGWIVADDALPSLLVEPPRFGAAPSAPPSGPLAAISVGGPEDLNYPPPDMISTTSTSGYVQSLSDGRGFCVLVEWRGRHAFWTIALADDPSAAKQQAQDALALAHAEDFERRRADHREWWRAQWKCAWLALPDAEIERQWTLDAYKLIAAARADTPPMALQGPWTGDDGRLPPWKGDYHHDLNTQMSYWPTLTANRPDAHRGFLEWLWRTRDACREWTASFFGCPGLNVPMTADLRNRQIGGWAPYTHSASTSAWLAAHFVREVEFSADEAFLRDRAAPYLFDVCVFIEAITAPNVPGPRRLALSSSPEINNNALSAWFEGWTNYDLALFRFALSKAALFAEQLGEDVLARRWTMVLEELPPLSRDADGGLSIAPGFALEESHRHFSHLLAFHPLGILLPDDESFAPSLARLVRLGPRNWMGYSFAWMAGIYALAGQGEACTEKLRQFISGFTDANSFHTNGEVGEQGLTAWPFNAFTLEGNCAAMAATQDMLLQSRDGVTIVFPALPTQWKQARFQRFRTYGGVLVSAVYQAPNVAVTLEGAPGTKVSLTVGREEDAEVVTLPQTGSFRCERLWKPQS